MLPVLIELYVTTGSNANVVPGLLANNVLDLLNDGVFELVTKPTDCYKKCCLNHNCLFYVKLLVF